MNEDRLLLPPNCHARTPAFLRPDDFARGNIGSAISSIFTPPGTNQRNNQVNQQSGYSGNVYNSLWPGLSSQLGSQQSFFNSQLPGLQQGVENAYQGTTQGGRNALVNATGQNMQAGARSQEGAAGAQFAGNPALAQGAKLAIGNNANTGTANFAAQANSAAGQQGAWNNFSNALNTASSSGPSYSQLGAMNGAIYGQPQVPVGQGLGSILGSLAGPVAAYYGVPGVGSALSSLGAGPSSVPNVSGTQGGLTD